MVIDPKVNLTITLQGRVMMSEQECSKNPKENYTTIVENHKLPNRKGKSTPYILKYQVRNSYTCRQSINLCKEAYLYMIDKKSKPEWYKGSTKWSNLSNKQRLEQHLKRISDSFNGISFTYQIFEE